MTKKNISETLKKLRTQKDFSQEQLAAQIGVSRPTYIQIEKGERELSLAEAQKLASIFGITLEAFLAGKTESPYKVTLVKDKNAFQGIKQEVRISVPQNKVEKFKEVLLYILSKVGGKPNVGETVLYKLLYFIDFDYYEKFEEQLIGATYIKNHYGPTPVEFKKIVEQMESRGEIETVKSKYFQHEQKKYLPHRFPDLSVLSAREKEHIDDVLARLSDKNAKELSDYSHGDIPWLTRDFGEPLSYESVFYRDEKYSVRNYDDEI